MPASAAVEGDKPNGPRSRKGILTRSRLLAAAKEIFEDRGRKSDVDAKNLKKERENVRLKDVIAEITSENLEQKKTVENPVWEG